MAQEPADVVFLDPQLFAKGPLQPDFAREQAIVPTVCQGNRSDQRGVGPRSCELRRRPRQDDHAHLATVSLELSLNPERGLIDPVRLTDPYRVRLDGSKEHASYSGS